MVADMPVFPVPVGIGAGRSAFSLASKDKSDIGNKGIDEAVHGFATNDKNVLPEPWSRESEANPMPVNGSLAKPAFA
jgi:hypothetical protein